MPDATSPVLPVGAIREALEHILASTDFDASERNRRFLRHVVEETLAGRADRIKGYSVAMAVFDREASFDPQIDPIVRIEASRLRRSLDHYYLTGGQDDAIRVSISKGGYVPTFTVKEAADPTIDLPGAALPASPPRPADPVSIGPPEAHPVRENLGRLPRWLPWHVILVAIVALVAVWRLGALPWPPHAQTEATRRQGPAVVVAPLEEGDAEAARLHLGPGLTREVIAALSRYRNLFVFGTDTSLQPAPGNSADALARQLSADYVLSGTVSTTPDRIRLLVSLVDARSGRHLWSQSYESPLVAARIVDTEADIARRVVDSVAQPYGAIYVDKISGLTGKAPEQFSSYECVLLFHAYWRRTDIALYPSARDCLERTIIDDPDYADAWAALALTYADQVRFGIQAGSGVADPLERALPLAQRAVSLAPNAPLGYQAEHLVFWLRHDVEQSFAAARAGLARSPNNAELLADLGGRLCLRGQFDEGLPLLTAAFDRNPGQSTIYRLGFFLAHYMAGRFEDALTEASRIDQRENRFTHIAQAIAYAQLGRKNEAAAELDLLLKLSPDYGDRVVSDLQDRNVAPAIIRAVVEGLRKAGLSVPNAGI
ncbi:MULTISPECIES: tetratricopeptide repeat protein [unclassified Inquilinus]|uniref:tetratricopeptide repeat protein n=1 Tax=unclassified Inquilinus TaxID=2645927 RepID=UPI003F9155EB